MLRLVSIVLCWFRYVASCFHCVVLISLCCVLCLLCCADFVMLRLVSIVLCWFRYVASCFHCVVLISLCCVLFPLCCADFVMLCNIGRLYRVVQTWLCNKVMCVATAWGWVKDYVIRIPFIKGNKTFVFAFFPGLTSFFKSTFSVRETKALHTLIMQRNRAVIETKVAQWLRWITDNHVAVPLRVWTFLWGGD